MQLGLVGLGKMGGNMRERLRNGGVEVVGYDHNPDVSDAASLEAMVAALTPPRAVWVMVPAGEITHGVLTDLAELLAPGDLVVDGGNSRYTDDIEESARLDAKGIGFVDCGVSGGVWGLKQGYALMCGGSDEHVTRLQPIFDALKPPGDYGFVHAGEVGAGHFAKMVHNGIEYGLMQAYAEGYELLETVPMVTDANAVIRSWREGTVIRSWLLDLLSVAIDDDPGLGDLRGYADDSGEGRWTLEAAIDHAVPMPVLADALFARFVSRQDESPAMKAVAAMRHQFGGHAVKAGPIESANPGPA